MIGMSRDRDETGARAQGRLTAETNCARHPGTAANNQDMAEIALVCGASSGRQGTSQMIIVYAAELGPTPLPAYRRHTKIREYDVATVIRPITEEQPGLQADKRDSHVGPHREAHDAAGVAVNTGGNVEGHNTTLVRIDRGNCQREIAVDVTFQSAAK